MQGLKNLENDLAKMYKEQDNYFGTQEHKNTIEFFDKMDNFDKKQVESKMLKDYEVYLDLFNEVNESKVQPIVIIRKMNYSVPGVKIFGNVRPPR